MVGEGLHLHDFGLLDLQNLVYLFDVGVGELLNVDLGILGQVFGYLQVLDLLVGFLPCSTYAHLGFLSLGLGLSDQ